MTEQSDRICRTVFRAIDAVNETLAPVQRIEKSIETRLMGNGTEMDSITIVNLILETEMSVEEEFGVSINLSNEETMDPELSPFSSIATLTAYIEQLL